MGREWHRIGSYADALEVMQGARSQERGRPLANNTRLKWGNTCDNCGKCLIVELHSTDIVTYYENGDVQLDHGNWQTRTTYDRINEFGPADVSIHGKIDTARSCAGEAFVTIGGWRNGREYRMEDTWVYFFADKRKKTLNLKSVDLIRKEREEEKAKEKAKDKEARDIRDNIRKLVAKLERRHRKDLIPSHPDDVDSLSHLRRNMDQAKGRIIELQEFINERGSLPNDVQRIENLEMTAGNWRDRATESREHARGVEAAQIDMKKRFMSRIDRTRAGWRKVLARRILEVEAENRRLHEAVGTISKLDAGETRERVVVLNERFGQGGAVQTPTRETVAGA